MVLVRINVTQMKQNPTMPSELRHANFNPSAWSMLVKELGVAESDACCCACAIEWAVCLLIGFPCIFCCHPLIQKGFQLDKEKNKIIMINNSFFNGNPVVVVEGADHILVNLDYITGHIQVEQPNDSNPIYAGGGSVPVATAAYVPNDAEVTVVKPEIQQTMKVVIPEGCAAGSVLTVAAPNGTQVQVTVPEGVKGGSEITIQY